MANAHCVFVISSSGHLVDQCGDTSALDIDSISTLIAANFMASIELSSLLGSSTSFKASYHEGTDYNIYAHAIDGDFLLAVIFGKESKQGIVQFYAQKLASYLAPLLVEQGLSSTHELDNIFLQALNEKLDDLFSQ